MVEYIYFVKCMDCEDEPFGFFDEAKTFALGKLSQKPEIHQTEVVRNDFGECTDSKDFGKVWSWEDEAGIVEDDSEFSIFTSGDFDKYNPEYDSEFDSLDNSLDDVPDNFRKPVPADMTIDGLVEAMEENEEMVECKRCNELFPKEDMLYELTRGYLCPICIMDLDAAGENLEFRSREIPEKVVDEEPLEESKKRSSTKYDIFEDSVSFYYNDLEATVQYNQTDADSWDEKEFYSNEFEYNVPMADFAEEVWNFCIDDESYKEFQERYEELYKDDAAWLKFVNDNTEELMRRYSTQLFDQFESNAEEKYQEEVLKEWNNGYLESIAETAGDENLLETLEESEEYKKRLMMCPECGDYSLDQETGICINCGFNTFD